MHRALVGPEALAMLERRTGLSLAPFPSTDELAIRANLYSAVGDGIGPHMDGNPLVVRGTVSPRLQLHF